MCRKEHVLLQLMHTHTHTHTHACMHTHTHTRMHTNTHLEHREPFLWGPGGHHGAHRFPAGLFQGLPQVFCQRVAELVLGQVQVHPFAEVLRNQRYRSTLPYLTFSLQKTLYCGCNFLPRVTSKTDLSLTSWSFLKSSLNLRGVLACFLLQKRDNVRVLLKNAISL